MNFGNYRRPNPCKPVGLGGFSGSRDGPANWELELSDPLQKLDPLSVDHTQFSNDQPPTCKSYVCLED